MRLGTRFYLVSLAASCALLAVPSGFAKDNVANIAALNSSDVTSEYLADFFKPRARTNKAGKTLDFSTMTTILETSVLYTGDSTRRRAKRPEPSLGSRITSRVGHTSPYRLEGNKVLFSAFNQDYKSGISRYQDELERMADEVDIIALPRNEQLAYWLNLHNLTVVEMLAKNYPVRYPRDMTVGPDNALLHDAKIINVQGKRLSLRDIREKIVFPNWKNPNVIYGFFQGDLGSPSLQRTAFNGRNISELLKFSADEFTNSLRSIHSTGVSVYVSSLYAEVAPYYFPNFPTDLKTHLRTHLREDVVGLLDRYPGFKLAKYESRIADTTGGLGDISSSGSSLVVRTNGNGEFLGERSTRSDYIEQIVKKREELLFQGRLRTSTVTIEDIDTEDRAVIEIE